MSTFALDELELAFAFHIVRQIVGADGEVGDTEQRWLGALFPSATLESAGFLAGGAFTDRFESALEAALTELPSRLTLANKLQLIETFLDASLADEHLHHAESAIVLQAAELLGIPPDELDRHLDSLEEVGTIELDEPLEG